MFLTNVLTRDDGDHPVWKEKFITGLPTLFSKRIWEKLKEATGEDEIDFKEFTFGQLFAFIKKKKVYCYAMNLKFKISMVMKRLKREKN